MQTAIIGAPTVASFTAHVFMVHVWFARYFFSINAVFWTIAVEVHFYICYPVYLWLRRQLGSAVTTVVLIFVGLLANEAALLLLHRGQQYSVFQRFFLITWWQWALGAALADTYVRGKAAGWAKLLSFKFAPAVYLVLSLLVGMNDYQIHGVQLRGWILPLACGALLGALVIRQTGHVPFLSNAGVYSYSIYLVHPVAFAALFALPGYRQLPSIVGVPATVVLATFMSWIFFLLVEQHFLSTRQRPRSLCWRFRAQAESTFRELQDRDSSLASHNWVYLRRIPFRRRGRRLRSSQTTGGVQRNRPARATDAKRKVPRAQSIGGEAGCVRQTRRYLAAGVVGALLR